MNAIFFKVSDKQNTEIKTLMDEEGYTSKAEFFRFLIKFFKYHKSPEELRFEKATSELATILKKLNSEGKLDTDIDEQLADV
jgi:hypothetical protein